MGDVQILRHFAVFVALFKSWQPFYSSKVAGNVAVDCTGCSLGEF